MRASLWEQTLHSMLNQYLNDALITCYEIGRDASVLRNVATRQQLRQYSGSMTSSHHGCEATCYASPPTTNESLRGTSTLQSIDVANVPIVQPDAFWSNAHFRVSSKNRSKCEMHCCGRGYVARWDVACVELGSPSRRHVVQRIVATKI